MANQIAKAKKLDVDVWTAALDRMRALYDRFDTVQVSFSGGKDSTAVLHLALEVAAERGKLPVPVVFVDEEAIPDPTIEYVRRVAARDDVDFYWYCVPIRHRNACSRKEPWWTCWDPEREDVWVRPMPEEAIRTHERFVEGMTLPDFGDAFQLDGRGETVQVQGIRAQESMRRRQAVSRRAEDNHITGKAPFQKAYPIYDWTKDDVWVAPKLFGWDYNTTYDVYEAEGLTLHQQRVCPPYGEQPLQTLHIYARTFPEMWERMIRRVHGAATAARYARTELYSGQVTLPPGVTYQQLCHDILSSYGSADRESVAEGLNRMIRQHAKKSVLPISDTTPDPISGISWKFLCIVANRGDLKGRIAQSMTIESDKELKNRGLSLDDAVRRYGTEDFKRTFFSRR